MNLKDILTGNRVTVQEVLGETIDDVQAIDFDLDRLEESVETLTSNTDARICNMANRLGALEATVNNFKRGDIRYCGKCGHLTAMVKITATVSGIPVNQSGFQCLTCGQQWREETETKMIPINNQETA